MKIGLYALLEVYEELREEARRRRDGEAFLFFCARCTECLELMGDKR